MEQPKVYTLESLPRAELTPPARLAVIGDPIAHSRSPQMQNPALVEAGIDACYVRVHVPIGQVAEAFRVLRGAGFLGVNVTIPHKFEALAAVDHLDPLAKSLGAVNTVAIRPDGLYGYNSDGPGFLNAVRVAFGKSVRDLRILILGAAGGAGQAVAVQCALVGCPKITLVNRTRAKAEALLATMAGGSDVSVVEWEPGSLRIALAEIDLIVNASPIGMKDGETSLLPAGAVRSDHLLFDMVYRSDGQPTALARDAAAASAAYVGGTELLIQQGAISFQHWFGIPAPVPQMRAGLASALSP